LVIKVARAMPNEIRDMDATWNTLSANNGFGQALTHINPNKGSKLPLKVIKYSGKPF
jgi:hypothetical protein